MPIAEWLLTVVFFLLMTAVLAFPVMWLWNGVGPNLFTGAVLRPIDYWNAWGLILLCTMLFKGGK